MIYFIKTEPGEVSRILFDFCFVLMCGLHIAFDVLGAFKGSFDGGLYLIGDFPFPDSQMCLHREQHLCFLLILSQNNRIHGIHQHDLF